MFFEKPDISAILLDVLELNQTNINAYNTKRNFNALSFRISADAELAYRDVCFYAIDNTVIFCPANLNYTRRAKHDHIIAVHFHIQNYFFEDMEMLVPQHPERFSRLFFVIWDTWQHRENGYFYKCNALLNELLAECFQESYSPPEETNKISPSVLFMEQNYKNPSLTIKHIAEKSFISEVYFRKLFKEEYGIPPTKHLTNLRLQNAVNLMSTGYYSLKEVALHSGYSDYSYFSVDFKKHMGCSPSEYLRSLLCEQHGCGL